MKAQKHRKRKDKRYFTCWTRTDEVTSKVPAIFFFYTVSNSCSDSGIIYIYIIMSCQCSVFTHELPWVFNPEPTPYCDFHMVFSCFFTFFGFIISRKRKTFKAGEWITFLPPIKNSLSVRVYSLTLIIQFTWCIFDYVLRYTFVSVVSCVLMFWNIPWSIPSQQSR